MIKEQPTQSNRFPEAPPLNTVLLAPKPSAQELVKSMLVSKMEQAFEKLSWYVALSQSWNHMFKGDSS